MSPLECGLHSRATAPPYQRQRRIMALGLLAPTLQKSILQGNSKRIPDHVIEAAPLAWADQLNDLIRH
jgi:hypothetical protein